MIPVTQLIEYIFHFCLLTNGSEASVGWQALALKRLYRQGKNYNVKLKY